MDDKDQVNELMNRTREVKLNQYRQEESKLLTEQQILDSRTRYPAHLFKRYFLPFFSGQVPMTQGNQVVANWVAIAGSPTSEVVIVDDKNNEVAVVPPMMVSKNINSIKDTGNRLYGDITSDYIMRKEISENMADNHMAMELDSKVNQLGDISSDTSVEKDWIKLMEYFGIEPPAHVDPTMVEEVKSSSDNRADDDFIYD